MISFANSVSLPAERRSNARHVLDGLAYVNFGAIVIDLGEGGLGFQSVVPVSLDHVFLLKLRLRGVSIECSAEVTWVNESGKRGGLRFVELSTDALARIRDWTGVVAAPDGPRIHPVESGGSAGSAQESCTKESHAEATQEGVASESITGSEAPAQVSPAFAEAQNAQASSVSPEITGELWTEEAAADQISAEQVPADLDTLPILGFIHDPMDIGAADSIPPLAAPAMPERAVRMPASDSENSLPVQKRKATPALLQWESPVPAESPEDSRGPRSFIRQSQKSVPPSPQSDNQPDPREHESKWEATPASEALPIGIGAAAGALLALALLALLPSLRTRLQATANPKSSASNLPNPQVFQVEVADLTNHRWILRTGGEAASPFSDVPLRETQAPTSRSESAKASRSEDNETSSYVPDEPQQKLAKPGELNLSRPHALQAAAPPGQVAAPSIFDGIAPPIGSVGDRLAASGPDAPRPEVVQPQSQAGARTSGLQAAVLVRRVEPVYPKIARDSRVMGQVRLRVTIGRDGVPREAKVLSGDKRLVDAALMAISQWRYRAATLGGEPIETQIIVSIDFELH